MSQVLPPPSPAAGSAEILLDGPAIDRLLDGLTEQIVSRISPLHSLALVGLPTRGISLARRLAKRIEAVHGGTVPPLGQIDVTFHRDDLNRRLPLPHLTEIPFDATDRHLLLVDDVLYTGRTVRAALSALMDFGRPASIRLLALIDRGHRQLPIQADFVGKTVATGLHDQVVVKLREVDGIDAVELVRAPGAAR